MNIPTKKLKNGFEIPIFGLGTWQMGGRKIHDFSNNDDADIIAIKNAINQGVTHIDTAEYYANGYAEVLLGRAIEKYNRSQLFLVSKVWGDNLSYEGVINACKKSLERINTSYLDLYLVHWFNEKFPLDETMKALDYLVASGLVKNIGVCNFGKENLAKAQNYTKNKIVCDQVHYNLIFREPEHKGLLKYCQQNDIFLMAWRPVEKGLLSQNVPEVVKDIAHKYQKTPAQIAINWLISQVNVVTLSKTRNADHLKENLGGVGWEMETEDIERLRNEYPDQRAVSNAVPLE